MKIKRILFLFTIAMMLICFVGCELVTGLANGDSSVQLPNAETGDTDIESPKNDEGNGEVTPPVDNEESNNEETSSNGEDNKNDNTSSKEDNEKNEDDVSSESDAKYENLSVLLPWLNEISAGEITQFIYQRENTSTGPENFGYSYCFNDTEIITSVLDAFQNMKVRYAVNGEQDVAGGTWEGFTLITAEGEKYSIGLSARYMFIDNYEAVKLSSLPDVPKDKASESTLFFVRFYDSFEIYTNTDDPQLIGEGDGFCNLEFKAYEGDTSEFTSTGAQYYVSCSAGVLYLYSDTVFSYQRYMDDSPMFYELCHGASFGEYISK